MSDIGMTDGAPPPGRRKWLALVLAGCVVAAVVVGAVLGRPNAEQGVMPTATSTTVGPVTTVATTPTVAPVTTVGPATTVGPVTTVAPPNVTTSTVRPPAGPDRLTPEARVRFDGIGPIRVGMTPEEAGRAAGVTLVKGEGPYCTSLAPSFDVVPNGYPPRSYSLVLTNTTGRVDMVEVFATPTATVSGIRVGSSVNDVMRAYSGQIVDRRNGAPTGRLVLRAPDSSMGDVAIVFVIDDGEVVSYRAGRRSVVEADEACA